MRSQAIISTLIFTLLLSWSVNCTAQASPTPTPTDPSTSTQVNLSSSFNRTGIVADGTTFGGGLDAKGYALSANLLGASVTFGSARFNLGPVGANDVVSAAGQTITLPSGSYGALTLLATGVNGSQAGQPFTVTYADGTKTTFTQSISDWHTPQNYSGEATAVTMSYRDLLQRDEGQPDLLPLRLLVHPQRHQDGQQHHPAQ